MTDSELQHLVTMINQISANVTAVDSEQQQAEKVADHIRRFWAKSMRSKLVESCAEVELAGDELAAQPHIKTSSEVQLSKVSRQALLLL